MSGHRNVGSQSIGSQDDRLERGSAHSCSNIPWGDSVEDAPEEEFEIVNPTMTIHRMESEDKIDPIVKEKIL